MSFISEPILFALSDISVIAVFANSAAFAVSPPKEEIKLAENDVTFSMYSLADTPAVLKASLAYCLTVPAESLKSVSIPPIDCCNFAPSSIADENALLTPPVSALIPLINAPLTKFAPKTDLKAEPSPPNDDFRLFISPWAFFPSKSTAMVTLPSAMFYLLSLLNIWQCVLLLQFTHFLFFF